MTDRVPHTRICECCGYRGGNEDGWIVDPESGVDLCPRCVADLKAVDEQEESPKGLCPEDLEEIRASSERLREARKRAKVGPRRLYD